MNLFEIGLGIVLLLIAGFFIYKNGHGIMKSLRERTEKNSIKVPNVTWTDRSGQTYTEDIIVKRSRIPLIGDWNRIYPAIKEEETGIWYKDIIWFNAIFGGTKNLIKLLLFLGIIALFFLAIGEAFSSYVALKEICEPYLNLP